MKDKKNSKESKTNDDSQLVELESQVKELEEKVSELENSKLRAFADYQNLQKRVEKEREELGYTLSASLLNSIIEIKEDLERHHESESNDATRAIIDKLGAILNERGVEEIEVKKEEDFDPIKMEAITTVPTDEKSNNKIIDIIQKGYKLNTGRVIRTAKVVVGKSA